MKRNIYLLTAFSTIFLFSACTKKECCCKNSQQQSGATIKQDKNPINPAEKSKKTAENTKKSKKTSKKEYLKNQNFPQFKYNPDKTGKNSVVYEPRKEDPVLKEMTEKLNKKNDEKTQMLSKIAKKQSEEKKAAKKMKMILKADIASLKYPKSLSEFSILEHNPPVPQFYTGTCWAFASTSFFESEIFRIKKAKIKLSEMWTVYWTYVEKIRRFIEKKGDSYVSEGDEPERPVYIWKKYGIVPRASYSGLVAGEKRYDHRPLFKELSSYLSYIKKNNYWDMETSLKHVKIILNKYLGKPPVSIKWNNKSMTPLDFLKNVTGLKLDDYVAVMSSSRYPFYTKQILDVPDNWSKNKSYINVPLDIWFNSLKTGAEKGYSVVLGGDVSEPGKIPELDLFFIPTFDIPSSLINQSSREFRIYNRTTADDHGIHLVGISKDKKWFLIKDSGRSSRWGKNKGYYFFSADYVKLKILTWFGHKDLIKSVLPKIK